MKNLTVRMVEASDAVVSELCSIVRACRKYDMVPWTTVVLRPNLKQPRVVLDVGVQSVLEVNEDFLLTEGPRTVAVLAWQNRVVNKVKAANA